MMQRKTSASQLKQLWRAVGAGDAQQVARLLLVECAAGQQRPDPGAGLAAALSALAVVGVRAAALHGELRCSHSHLLHLAVERGDISILTLLLEHGQLPIDAPIEATLRANDVRRGFSPLLLAASLRSDARLLRILLTHGAQVNFAHPRWTALTLAVVNECADAVCLLLVHGADPERPGGLYRDRALGFAVRCNEDTAVLRMLLKHGARVDVLQRSRKTALFLAASAPKLEVITLLVSHGADVDARIADGCTALHGAADRDFDDAVKVLIAEGADVNARDATGKTALHRAALCSGTLTLRTLLAHGASALVPDDHGVSPLCYATRYGKLDAVRVLLDASGVCEALVDPRGLLLRVLGEAVTHDRDGVVALLLEKVQAVNRNRRLLDPVYRTAMAAAARGHKWVIARLLAQASVSLDTRDADGRTLLHAAAETGDLRFVQLLLACGAAADALDGDARTPLDIALEEKFVEVIDCLQQHGASPLHRRHRSSVLDECEPRERSSSAAGSWSRG